LQGVCREPGPASSVPPARKRGARKTTSSYFADDWFRPENVGYLDDDGFLYYSDRAVDTIDEDRSDFPGLPARVQIALD